MKLLDRSIKLARQLHTPNKQQFNVYAFMYYKNKLLSIGCNEMLKPNKKVLDLAERFNVEHFKKFPYKCAEIDCIGRLWGKHYISGKETIVVVRLLKDYSTAIAKPCKNCQQILDALLITKILHT